MNWIQFAILQCNLFICTAIITDKILPIVLSILWLAVNVYFQYCERKFNKENE